MPPITCPFCGQDHWEVKTDPTDGTAQFFFCACMRCGAQGGIWGSREEAVAQWEKMGRDITTEMVYRAAIAWKCFPCGGYAARVRVCDSCSAYPNTDEFNRAKRALEEALR